MQLEQVNNMLSKQTNLPGYGITDSNAQQMDPKQTNVFVDVLDFNENEAFKRMVFERQLSMLTC